MEHRFLNRKRKEKRLQKKNGWEYDHSGDVQSGKDPTREGYSELLYAIDKKEIDAVWLTDEDRFARMPS